MALVVESVSTLSVNTAAGPITITKPSGLAVGNEMLAFILHESGTVTTPSGWTEIAGLNTTTTKAYWKVADSADAAASNFSWTTSGVTEGGGVIYRLSGSYVASSITGGGADTGNENTISVAVSVTPYVANSLVILLARANGSTNPGSHSNYVFTGGTNPTFTERIDESDPAVDTVWAIADGIYTQTTTITAIGYETDIALSNQYCYVIVVPPQADASGSNTLVTTTSQAFAQSGTCDGNTGNTLVTATSEAFTQSGTGTAPTTWTNPNKSSASWSNENK